MYKISVPISVIFASFVIQILASHFPNPPGKSRSNSTAFYPCAKGYALSKTNSCEPVFTNGCPRKSFCLGNNSVCRCDKKMTNLQDDECLRLCRVNCPGKNCLLCRPGECLCPSGYTMSNGQCQPICQNGCPNGYCFRPEICLCNNGYARSLDGTCSPSDNSMTGSVLSHGLGRVVLKKDDTNTSYSSERSSNYIHRIKRVMNHLIDIANQNGKMVILTTSLVLLAIVLLLSMYGILKNGTYDNLATEEYKAREPFYVYF